MKNRIIIILFFLHGLTILYTQELVTVEGAITIGTTDEPTPEGAIRWNGTDFQAWKGSQWVSLTGEKFILDIDNNKYPIVKIGNQLWMKENLRSTHYNDGTPIPLVTDGTTWSGLSSPGYTWYENAGSVYGALYNFYVVADTNSHKVCPSGWDIPTSTEWNTMMNFLGGSTKAGGLLKESGLAHWEAPNTGGTNDSSFTGIPGGWRSSNGSFSLVDQFGFWWSSTSSHSNEASFYSLIYNDIILNTNIINKKYGMSIRCVKNL